MEQEICEDHKTGCPCRERRLSKTLSTLENISARSRSLALAASMEMPDLGEIERLANQIEKESKEALKW